jgi:hypothetical protein
MLKVFQSIGVVNQSRHVQEIVSIVHFNGFITSKGLWAKSMNYMPLKEFEEAVRAAVKGGLLEVTTISGITGVVCPSPAKKGTSAA